MLIKPLLLDTLESALNRYLSLDEDASRFLEPLAGKIVAVRIQPFDLVFFLCPSTEKIQILESCLDPPDTTLTGSATALGLMALSSTPIRTLFSGQVTLSGDTETGRKFQQLFEQLDIDLEEALSHYTGDIIAHKIGRIVKTGQQWSKETAARFRLNLTEFLQEETRDLPSAPEMELFCRQVDNLRADFDRLHARIERLLTTERDMNDTQIS